MASQQRPAWVDKLLTRPLPRLVPPRLTESANPPWSPAIRSQIADAMLNPLLESALHLANDDLFSAHFLLRKVQEDDWGKYLHGILHKMEGDYANVKAWLHDSPISILSTFYTSSDPRREAVAHIDRIARLRGKTVQQCEETTKQGKLQPQNVDAPPDDVSKLDEQAEREHGWRQIVSAIEQLEKMHGWGAVDGTKVYTQDSDGRAKQKMVLGEGWRQF